VAERQILHIDMNAFYCSCHEAAEPALYRGKPTAVAGSPETRHGVVVTASYEARRRGVRATMTVPEAQRICPDIIFIAPDFKLYREYSRRAFDVVRRFTPLIEIFSIDECWADVTGSRQFGTALDIARSIQECLLHELSLPCSIGVGPNKFLTKMASDFHKPLGITELWTSDVQEKLWPLSVGQMFGIGKKSAERLERMGIRTIGDLARADVTRLARVFGKRAMELIKHANGIDDSPVTDDREPPKSIGHSITLPEDVSDLDELRTVLLNLSDQVGRRMRHHMMVGKTVQITMRYTDRKTVTRARTLDNYTDLTEQIYETAYLLLSEHKPKGAKLRLVGVAVSGLCKRDKVEPTHEQLTLFDWMTAPETDAHGSQPHELSRGTARKTSAHPVSREKLRTLTEVTDRLRDKYGEDIVIRGRMLYRHPSEEIRNHQKRGTSLQKDKLQ
jgi:DNA polymerase IV